MIRAFAIRTASALVGRFFGYGVFSCPPAAGIMGSSGVGAIEPCATGCMLMGPGDVGLLFGIMNNARVPHWFDARTSSCRRQRPQFVVIRIPEYDLKHGGCKLPAAGGQMRHHCRTIYLQ